jgi:hypothetical protein
MPTPTTLKDLHSILQGSPPLDVLNASWEAFDLGQRAADGVVWEEGFDEIRALAAAQTCTAGRALLPLPRNGRPFPLPGPPGESIEACAALLRQVNGALRSLPQGPEGAYVDSPHPDDLSKVADLAMEAAETLDSLRAG